ncbi:histidine kinase dimerization/phospho-acceptor domain-containing protein [Candidatus Williamhamiltonella defendens]|uniref:histidine kinase dimerization/phospho-acceptor domain-containing protein n=1 Tax=Candidatus Williamhamiltonella defendens TaxID=138072 RepID=UPI0016519F1C|nr:histidine kinase dimerization/phospho-acceptor domain-containing protein [Candidatus Hamiltonella defensa]
MRTPLNIVIGFARQTLKTSETPSPTDYIEKTKQSVHNLLSIIINDVLDFSKLNEKTHCRLYSFAIEKNLDTVMIFYLTLTLTVPMQKA